MSESRFQIRHDTRYRYMDRVFLEPHAVRLTPRRDARLRVLSWDLKISPEPAGICETIELEGTSAHSVWFQGMTDQLDVEVRMSVAITPVNPFDFIIYPLSCQKLPMIYPGTWAAVLAPYLSGPDPDPDVAKFAGRILKESGPGPVMFLSCLTRVIFEEFSYAVRESGDPWSDIETLRREAGSCRDFAVLAMSVCRSFGIASRYVSGYFLGEDDSESGELHAWFEAFLPGAGWKGFDPAHGIACDHRHLALSASAAPSLTLPVTGSFRGAASSRMTTLVTIKPG